MTFKRNLAATITAMALFIAPTAQAAVLTESTLPAGTAVSFDLPADFAGYQNVEVTGLPAGLTYDPATRTISGVPEVGGDFIVSITANGATSAVATTVPLHVTVEDYMNEPPVAPEETNPVLSFFKTLFGAIIDIISALFQH